MDITYLYQKKRKYFGRQTMFCETPPVLIDSIASNLQEQKNYSLRNPVNETVQVGINLSEHYMNTTRITTREHGANHAEGGWPKEISYLDEEATSRYRRRIEREDDYVHAVLQTYPKFVHYIKQNNAIELYNLYFKGMPEVNEVEKSTIVLKNKYKDTSLRPVSCLAWTAEEDTKLVVTYCDTKYPLPGSKPDEDVKCNVWDLSNADEPFIIFNPPSACWRVVCSPVSPATLISGLADGRVCVFDLRDKTLTYKPVAISPIHLAHRDPVNSLVFINSRMNTEFFSGSSDGQFLWWDIRYISMPMDMLCMSVRPMPGEQPHLGNAEPVSALQFERSFPTRFLCGTDTGLVINVNRKGKTFNEMMSAVFHAQSGPVRAVHRSPLTTKMFITCGDWRVRIWSDDVLSSPIIPGTEQRYQINDVAWAPHRISGYICITANGKLQFWDLLRKYREPVITHLIAKVPLLKVVPHEDGRLVAVGDERGATHLLQLSDNLVHSGERDKQLMLQIYERETRRERILESRVKEIRLKLKGDEENEDVPGDDVVDEAALIKTAEEAYRKGVMDEFRASGITPDKSGLIRKR